MSLGAKQSKPDAAGKVTGSALYAGDLRPAGLLHAKAVFTNEPHARIEMLDVSGARALDGVVLVITAEDVPVNEYGLTISDQPVLVGPRSSGRSEVPHDVSRWEADHLAIIVAETVELCDEAAALIEAQWVQLPLVEDLDAALGTDAFRVHPETEPGNAYHHIVIRKGDVDTAFEQADVIIEGTYSFPHQEHAFLQTEVSLGYLDEERRITVETAGQWTHEDQEQIAHSLDIELAETRVIYRAIGGAFGGKEDMSLQIVAALAVKCLRDAGVERPVRLEWNREESIVGHHKRHRGRVSTRWAARSDGTLLGVEADVLLDAGAYNYTSNKVLGNLHLSVSGPYVVPSARIDSMAVYTNAVPGGAFRGFGGPQGTFVAECQMNKLAEACGLDPVEVRRRNLLEDGSIGITGVPLPEGVSIGPVLEACADAAEWGNPQQDRQQQDASNLLIGKPERLQRPSFASLPVGQHAVRSGRGIACAYKNIGFSFGFPECSHAKIVLTGDGTLPSAGELFLAGADVGQGAHTAFIQMASEATGIAFEAFSTTFSDTARTGDSGSASASRLSWMAGNAIIGAAEVASAAWSAGDRPAIGEFEYRPPPTEPLSPDGAPSQPNFAYGYVAEAVDLSVDIETGHITVHNVYCAIDVGRIINPDLVVGQIEGAIMQAHGYALSEDLVVEQGRVLNPRLSGYLIPGIGDGPQQIQSILLEVPDPLGPFGVRGMAEMPLIPYTPAVVAALHDATGVWFDEFPLTPPRVQAKLSEVSDG